MATITPIFETGDVTFKATDPVVGGRFVAPSGNRTGGLGLSDDLENVYLMAHAAANGPAAGVAADDVADNALGKCLGTPGRIVPMDADGAIAAGVLVQVGADGKAKTKTSTNVVVGLAMSAAVDGIVEVKVY